MADPFEEVFNNLRRSAFADDPNSIPQERMANDGQGESVGWLADNSVTSDVIRANAVIAAKISAGAVETDKLAANAVTAAKIAANTITANEIAANAITTSELNAGAVTAAKIAANTITANEIAANTLTASEIAANAITASEIAADAVTTTKILAANVTSSRIELTVTGKNFGANDGSAGAPGLFFDSASNYGIRKSGSSIVLDTAGALNFGWTTVDNVSYAVLRPSVDNLTDLGTTSFRWATVYRVAESAVSDEREKRDILDAPLGLDFVRSLKPRVFRWRETADTQAREAAEQSFDRASLDAETAPLEARIRRTRAEQQAGAISDARADSVVVGLRAQIAEITERHSAPVRAAHQKRRTGRRLHYGLIAQEVKAALDAAGVDSVDAGFWQEAPGGEQSLSYSQLMIPLLRAVQEQDAEIAGLRARIEQLESKEQ